MGKKFEILRFVALCTTLGVSLLTACNSGSAEATPTPTVAVPVVSEATATASLSQPTQPAPPQPSTTPALIATPTQNTLATPATSAASGCVNRAGNVRDVTVPDDTALQPGTPFTKTWRLRNAGTCTWTDAYTLVFMAGDRMDGASTNRLTTTPPGADVTAMVVLVAPLKLGKYKGYWKLRDANGHDFGTGAEANIPFWVQIIVRRK